MELYRWKYPIFPILFSVILLASSLQSQVFAFPGGDAGGEPVDLPGGDLDFNLPVIFTVEYDPTAGPIQKDFPNFPQLSTETITEIITVGAGSPDITDWHEEGGRILSLQEITDQRIVWVSATITLDDGSTCTVTQPDLTNTCGDITITRDTSGFTDPPGNTIYDLVWFDFPNNPQKPGDTFTIVKEAFWPFTVAGGGFFFGVNEFPTSEPVPPMDPVVGGELIPLDTTMILLVGTHSLAAWMIPVIVSGIGFAIVILRKF